MPGLYIAKQGGSLNSPEKDWAFSSDRTCLMEIMTGNGTTGASVVTINHNLGYFPSFQVWVKRPNIDETELVWHQQVDGVEVDETNLYIDEAPGLDYAYRIHANASDGGGGTGNNNILGQLIIGKPGINLKTNTDARNIQFMSGVNVPKIDRGLSGSISAYVDAFEKKVITVTHNLGYPPVFYVNCVSTGQTLPVASNFLPIFAYTNNTTITIIVDAFQQFDPMGTLQFKYLITRDKII